MLVEGNWVLMVEVDAMVVGVVAVVMVVMEEEVKGKARSRNVELQAEVGKC